MEILTINDYPAAKAAIAAVDCTDAGIAIMAEKAIFRVIKLTDVDTKAANILKQTMLSKGGDAAISRHCADLSQPVTDVILMATVKQYRAVIPVLLQQPWGLRQTAHDLKQILKL